VVEDVRGGRSAHQQDQPEQLPEDQVQQQQRHVGIMPNPQLPLVNDPALSSGTPQAVRVRKSWRVM
jgi:hypothetical protein